MKRLNTIATAALLIMTGWMIQSCQPKEQHAADNFRIRLITLAPAHFHAALVQKSMYPQIDSVVHVYAPAGPELQEHLNFINQYNHRAEDPTHWVEKVYTGSDYLEKMLSDKAGNVVVLAGNNKEKTTYITRSVDAGMNVLADKPMAINTQGFEQLKQAFSDARQKGVILYDIMTERSEITTILQRELSHMPAVFGALQQGTKDDPGVRMESVHRFFKQVSGTPLTRPDWFFDPQQEGDAIADVGTHLVDLVQWECFPDTPIDYEKDIDIGSSRIWPTPLTLSQFATITKEDHFPDFLKPYVKDDSILLTHANGEIDYTIRGIHTRVTAKWDYAGPDGAGDTHYSLLKGTRASLEIRQTAPEAYEPTLYIWPAKSVKDVNAFADTLQAAIQKLAEKYPGISTTRNANGWKVLIPQQYKVGHEAHFAQVMDRYLNFLQEGKLPGWEESDMIAKYYTTTKALEMATSAP
jgi:predicted dehydrogenase